MSRSRIAQAMLALAIAAISCDVSFPVPLGSQFPTAAPGMFETVVAGTAGAAQSQTAVLAPPSATITLTPTASRTPTVIPSSTPTFIFRIWSVTPPRTSTPTQGAVAGNYACVLLSQKPADGTEFKANAKFDAVWEVRNSGSATWKANNVDFAYASGRKMQEQDVYDLPRDVKSGESVKLIVDMVAPKLSGNWKTVWTLRKGGDDFCHVDLTITVP